MRSTNSLRVYPHFTIPFSLSFPPSSHQSAPVRWILGPANERHKAKQLQLAAKQRSRATLSSLYEALVRRRLRLRRHLHSTSNSNIQITYLHTSTDRPLSTTADDDDMRTGRTDGRTANDGSLNRIIARVRCLVGARGEFWSMNVSQQL